MSKRAAVRIDHIGDYPLDLPGAFVRAERRYWADGTSCLHLAKWGYQQNRGCSSPWQPLQYLQVPWELVEMYAVIAMDCKEESTR